MAVGHAVRVTKEGKGVRNRLLAGKGGERKRQNRPDEKTNSPPVKMVLVAALAGERVWVVGNLAGRPSG